MLLSTLRFYRFNSSWMCEQRHQHQCWQHCRCIYSTMIPFPSFLSIWNVELKPTIIWGHDIHSFDKGNVQAINGLTQALHHIKTSNGGMNNGHLSFSFSHEYAYFVMKIWSEQMITAFSVTYSPKKTSHTIRNIIIKRCENILSTPHLQMNEVLKEVDGMGTENENEKWFWKLEMRSCIKKNNVINSVIWFVWK